MSEYTLIHSGASTGREIKNDSGAIAVCEGSTRKRENSNLIKTIALLIIDSSHPFSRYN